MKIIINAFQYAPTVTGTDRMAHNFLQELQILDNSDSYIVVCSRVPYIPSVITGQNFKIISPLSVPGGALAQRVYNKLWRTLLPFRLSLLRADVFLSFHNMSLPSIRVAKRMIAYNLDLIPLRFDEYAAILGKDRESLLHDYRKVVRQADHFVSISQFSKSELCEELDVPEASVSVIHLAADSSLSEKTSKLDLPASYFLTIGGSEPRKNVQVVVDAFRNLPENIQKDTPLVIAGGEWHGHQLDKFSQTPNVICVGYVDEASLGTLYKNAKVFVFASYYEGFGFTILEAMASGVPVLSAESSSLTEVAGNAAVLFDPSNPEELSELMNELNDNAPRRKELIKLGLDRAGDFSWNHSARRLHELLTKVQ